MSSGRVPALPDSPSWLPSVMKSGASAQSMPKYQRCASYCGAASRKSPRRLSVMNVSPRSMWKSGLSARAFCSMRSYTFGFMFASRCESAWMVNANGVPAATRVRKRCSSPQAGEFSPGDCRPRR